MPVYLKKTRAQILTEALQKVETDTPITSLGPGSIARAMIEAVTTEIADLYEVLDFNIEQTYVSTATGSALDALGALYGVQRKSVSDLAVVDKSVGAFQFYIDAPHSADIVIPAGTNVYTAATSYVGRQYSFSTVSETIIPIGRTRAFASLQPNFVDTVYTAGRNTLTFHDATNLTNPVVRCTNPKPISPLPSYESDDDFRLRVIKQMRVTAAGTAEAVRFAGLAVPNVRDIKIRTAPYGMGSFEAVVVPEVSANRNQTLAAARIAMDEVRPLGVRMFVKSPQILPVDLEVDVFLPGGSSTRISDNISSRIKVGLTRYLQSLLPGQPVIFNRMVQIALDANELIKDVSISSVTINGSPQLMKNYQPQDDEQITSGNIVVNVA